MLEKELIELFCLCRKVMKETKAYVWLETCSNIEYSATVVRIIDKGYDKNHSYDGSYDIFDDELLRESALEECRAAKEHLARLLKENGS